MIQWYNYAYKNHNRHEDLSVNAFKKMLKDNPKVLAEFIDEGLTKEHVTLVEEMIDPPKNVEDRADPDRMFLYEVSSIASIAAWYTELINYTNFKMVTGSANHLQ